jgi:large subunit ribosomal protein L31
MKTGIHPQYFPQAKVNCSCGASFVVGSTKPEIHVEICSNCHPFYTGNEKVLDIAGRVERFKARKTKAAAKASQKSQKNAKVKRTERRV